MGNVFSIKKKRKVIEYKNEDYYEGEVIEDLPDGLGIKLIHDVGKYEGFFHNGMRNGRGRIYFFNGEFFMGQWENDQITGFGEFFYSDHTRYSGNFKNGKKHGMGILYNFDNSYYKGNFYNNQKDGVGEIIKRNKKVFDQIWDKGKLLFEVENLAKTLELKKFDKEKIKINRISLRKSFSEKKSIQINTTNDLKEDLVLDNQVEQFENLDNINESKKKGIYKLSSRVIRNAGPETLSIIDFKDKLNSFDCIFEENDIKKWSIGKVAEFLESFGLEKYKQNFISNKISGKILLLLSKNDITDLGISKIGDHIVVRDLIKKLRVIYKNSKKERKLKSKLMPIVVEKEIIKKNIEERENFLQAIIKEESSSLESYTKTINSINLSEDSKSNDCEETDFLLNQPRKQKEFINLRSRSVNFDKKSSSNSPRQQEKFHSQETLKSLVNASIYPNYVDLQNNDLSFETSSSSDSDESQNPLDNNKLVRLDYIEKIGPNLNNFIIKKEDLKLQDKIGEGAYGEVYLAKYFETDVAIKIFDRTKFKSNIRKKFIQEAEILCSLRSPFIVLFMGVCLNYKNYMLITEYMEQGSLYNLLHITKIKMSFDKKLSIIESISHGMNHLHERKVLHCDLKSSNILIMDNYRKVKLCDFGLSTVKNKLQKRNRNILGKPHWMAPEILRGEKYDEASDVFSFGMVIWEILTEQIPYNQLSIPQIVGSVGFDYSQKLILPDNTVCMYRLEKLMETCLSRKSKLRPCFDMIVKEIDLIKDDLKRHKKIESELENFFK